LLVTARINSQVTASFIVDTGASTVTISHAVANELGIDYANKPRYPFVTASGFVTSPMIVLESIYVPDEAGAGVARVEAAVSTLPGAPPGIAGLLGQTFLRHFRVTIDAERRVMHLEANPATRGMRQ
jgi:predicted aspartyl protease